MDVAKTMSVYNTTVFSDVMMSINFSRFYQQHLSNRPHSPIPTVFILTNVTSNISNIGLLFSSSPVVPQASPWITNTIIFLQCEMWPWNSAILKHPKVSHCLDKAQASKLLYTRLHPPQILSLLSVTGKLLVFEINSALLALPVVLQTPQACFCVPILSF